MDTKDHEIDVRIVTSKSIVMGIALTGVSRLLLVRPSGDHNILKTCSRTVSDSATAAHSWSILESFSGQLKC